MNKALKIQIYQRIPGNVAPDEWPMNTVVAASIFPLRQIQTEVKQNKHILIVLLGFAGGPDPYMAPYFIKPIIPLQTVLLHTNTT